MARFERGDQLGFYAIVVVVGTCHNFGDGGSRSRDDWIRIVDVLSTVADQGVASSELQMQQLW